MYPKPYSIYSRGTISSPQVWSLLNIPPSGHLPLRRDESSLGRKARLGLSGALAVGLGLRAWGVGWACGFRVGAHGFSVQNVG